MTDLLICFDAFGTLFYPKRSIAEQYGKVARQHGLSGFTNHQIHENFRKAFKEEAKRHPNYGKDVGLAAPEWWGNIIKKTFKPFVQDAQFPPMLVPNLLRRFSSEEGYALYDDVLPFFEKLRKVREAKSKTDRAWPWRRTAVGIITNSDDRVPSILRSFGLVVGSRYDFNAQPAEDLPHRAADIDFVTLSYDVGFEKPHKNIFSAAVDAAKVSTNDELDIGRLQRIYIGDDFEKDVVGALDSGWEGISLNRGDDHPDRGEQRISRTRTMLPSQSGAPREVEFWSMPDLETLYSHMEGVRNDRMTN
ncbi:MAG: hypothetical protein M1820_006978 [Bogoriella megaspora]|nr:MAG: hypothetical protein M1820_006978 [Bogoriella megaspora]